MTVKELILKLQKLDENLEVYTSNSEYGIDPDVYVEVEKHRITKKRNDWHPTRQPRIYETKEKEIVIIR